MSTMQRIYVTLTPVPSSTYKQQQIPSTPTSVDGDHLSFIMNAINGYRVAHGLSQVSTNDIVCDFAKTRADEISTNFSHDGFHQRLQNRALPYATYSLVTENIAETPNYQNVVTLWENSPAHAENLRANTPFVCVEDYGNFYAFEGWRE